MDISPWLTARYCVRQDSTAFLEMWGLLLVLVAAAIATLIATRRRGRADLSTRVVAGALFFFALLTAVLAASTLYGCSMTAAAMQGLGSDLPAGTFAILRCLGTDVLGMINAWLILILSCTGAIVLIALGIARWKAAARVIAFIGAALLLTLTFASGFLMLFGYSLCSSGRLI